ncbi:MAG: efflux RND transporter permease subunit [Terriglobales bacterium]
MINRIVQAALHNRFLVLLLMVLLIIGGVVSFRNMPIEAYPNLSPPMVEIITQWPGHSPLEIERLITLPLELAMNGIPNLTYMRSISLYGLSDITLTFTDSTDPYFNRELVFQRFAQATLPNGVTPSMSPMSPPSGIIYRYVLQSPDRSAQDLHTIETWTLERAYKSIPGVADDSGFGGTTMQYQVLLDPVRLANYHVTVPEVMAALANNNENTGGGFYSQGGQFYYVRANGLVTDRQDIGDVVVASNQGAPVYVHDVAQVVIGHAPRLGEFGFDKSNDAVEGVIMMRRGAHAQDVLKAVEAKTAELNRELPPDVKIDPYYDRTGLVNLTIDTVEGNLLHGIILVLIILILLLVSVRAAVIIALTIPLALLFAFIFLHAWGISANLLSIGAIDFGIIIDGTVIMMENIYREMEDRHGQQYKLTELIITAAKDVDRPIFFSVAVMIAAYLPIYALTGESGRLFRPMADTMAMALVGSLIITLTLVPVLSSYWFKRGIKLTVNKPLEWIKRGYRKQVQWSMRHPAPVLVGVVILFGLSLSLVPHIGGEFMPHMDEGALWVRATMPYSISFEEASRISPQIRHVLMSYPQVTDVGSELGRPDDGTDSTGFFNDEFYVGLKPYNDPSWQKSSAHTKQEFIDSLEKRFAAFPGIIFNYTQPAEDAVDEALTGLKSALAVKVFGPNLEELQTLAVQVRKTLSTVPGFTDLTVVKELGQPSIVVNINRAAIARYGINVSDVEDVVEAGVGGVAVTQVVHGEELFDLVVRMEPQYRSSPQAIGSLLVGAPGGQQIPLRELASITEQDSPSFIYRENNERYVGVQYSIQGRDLEHAVDAGKAALAQTVHLPQGYRMVWGGEYSEFVAARQQIAVVGPLVILLIFLILFILYGNFKFPVVIAIGVLLSLPEGALFALWATGTPFSVSSALGLLAVTGVAAEETVILVSYINKLRLQGQEITSASIDAAVLRLRPIMITALVACLGLLPAALSHGIGSDTQRPFALVIVTGMLSTLILGLCINPILYKLAARKGDVLQV